MNVGYYYWALLFAAMVDEKDGHGQNSAMMMVSSCFFYLAPLAHLFHTIHSSSSLLKVVIGIPL